MSCFTQEQLSRISHLIKEIEKLSDIEKLFLYLQLPCGRAESGEGKAKSNGRANGDLFAKKPDQETTQTYTWILSHLEEDSNVSLPKQEVYDEYRAFCQASRFEPLCVADFGKAMKHAFPCIKPRRLGQRGNSRYCYSGLRKKYKIQAPTLPDLIEPTFCMDNDCSQAYNQIIKDCRENPSECFLNNCEVMNLKVEPHNSNSSYNCTNNGNGFGYNMNEANHNRLSGTGGRPDPMMLSNKQQRTNSTSSNQQNPTLTPLVGTNYQQQQLHQNHPTPMPQPIQPIPSTSHQQAMARYNQQQDFVSPRAGTPDDDDYRHNYLGSTPMDCHMAITGLPIYQTGYGSDTAQTPTSSESASSGTNFLYPNHSTNLIAAKAPGQEDPSSAQAKEPASHSGPILPAVPVTQTASHIGQNQVHEHQQQQPQQSSQQQFSRDNTNSMQSAPISSSSLATAHQLSNIYNSSIDFCASPFQSPASTPYPVMGNYLSQDVPNYCLNNDCVRCVDQQ